MSRTRRLVVLAVVVVLAATVAEIHDLSSTVFQLDLSGIVDPSIVIEPEAARRISRVYEVIVGARLSDYQNATVEQHYSGATIEDAATLQEDQYTIQGTLVEVILRDRNTLGILKRWKPVKKPVEHEATTHADVTPTQAPVPYVPSDKAPVETVVSGLDFTTTTVPVPRQPGH
jgi:hypothetical protein